MSKILKCKKCRKEITGGFYNAPDGAYCCECWDKKPKADKDIALRIALIERAVKGMRLIKILDKI